jgi:hypothetical protein
MRPQPDVAVTQYRHVVGESHPPTLPATFPRLNGIRGR